MKTLRNLSSEEEQHLDSLIDLKRAYDEEVEMGNDIELNTWLSNYTQIEIDKFYEE